MQYGAETWTLQKINRSKIQKMDIKLTGRVGGCTRRGRLGSEVLREEIGIQNVLIRAGREISHL
jgi:hypothetical protein